MAIRSGILRRADGQRGIAMVEFVIVAPLLVLLMLAFAELGRALYQYTTLTKCVRDGARYLAENGRLGSLGFVLLTDGLSNETRNLVVYGNVAGSGAPSLSGWTTAQVSVSSPDQDHVRVQGSYTFQPMMVSLPTFGFSDGPIDMRMTFQSTVLMRAL